MSPTPDWQPDERRNFAAFFGDFFFFGVAMSFVSQTTVLPSLARQLTDSAPLIGLVSTLQTGGWMLPQLIASNYVGSYPLKKPLIVIPALIGRATYPLLALAIWSWAETLPDLVLALLLIAITFFFICDGLASVPWFDLFSKSLPPARRGRLIGVAQMSTGLVGVGAGAAVSFILGPQGPGFPANYALLFAIASLFFFVSLVALLQVREHPSEETTSRQPWSNYLARLASVMYRDRTFCLVIVVRLLVAWANMASPFYVVYALDVLGFDQGVVGVFVSAQVIGGILSGMIMGYLNERRGTRAVIRLAAALAVSAPLLALAMAALRLTLPLSGRLLLYAPVFSLLGALGNAGMAGFMSYILEAAPPGERPTYVGLANTLSAVVLLAPFLGGWILAATSYPVLFSATALICLIGLIGAWRLEEPRHRATQVS